MKRSLIVTLTLICILCFNTVSVAAKSYDVGGTDITVNVDSEDWCVFTRENIRGNSEIKSLGITENYFYNSMINTNTYLDMFYLRDNDRDTIEFEVIKENTTDTNNYKNLTKKQLSKIGEQLSGTRGAQTWELYYNECSYIYLEYKINNLNCIEYYTVVNQEIYKLVGSKANNFSETEKEMLREIVDDVQYTINPVYATETWGITKFWAEYYIQIIVAVILIIVIATAVIVYKKRIAIKNFITGKKSPNEQVKKELETTRYVEVASKQVPKQSASQSRKSADPSMVTINRQKRKVRKAR